MDLPSCPACGQSVLDEDAADCPFCGASMSGKGGGGGASAKAAAKSGSAKGGTKKKADKEGDSGKGDDPFEVASPVTGKVIQLLPKPSKGRLHRMVCPMCETPGFHSKNAAGKDVKCANPECLVPLFTSPPLEEEVAAEPVAEPKKGMGIISYVVIGLIAAAALGGGAWVLTDDAPAANENEVVFKDDGSPEPPDGPEDPPEPGSDPDEGTITIVEPVPAGPPAAELRTKALQWMYQLSLDADANRKPYCRRLAAEAWARMGPGNEEEVNGHLAQLEKTGGSRMAYQKVLPGVEVAWQMLAAGDQAGAVAKANSFVPMLEQLPPQGMLALDIVTELAVLRVALGQEDEARTLLASRQNDGPLGQLMESLARARFTALPFNRAVGQRPPLGWADPQAVAVTVGLTARGLDAQAQTWATTPECVAAWAQTTILRAGSAEPLAAVQGKAEAMAPLDKARYLSRIGLALDAIGAEAEAKTTAAETTATLTSVGTPAPLQRPDLQEQRNFNPPDKSAERNAAFVALEVAQLELAVNGPDAAWKSIEFALAQTRGIAPSLTAAREPSATIARLGPEGVKAQLKLKYGLQTEDEARNEFRLYQNRIARLQRSAVDRFALQGRILTTASEWGLVDQVWAEMQSREANDNSDENEPWYESPVAAIVRDWFLYSNADAKKGEVEQLAAKLKPENSRSRLWAPRYGTSLYAQKALEEDNWQGLARLLNGFATEYPSEAERRWQQETLLRSVSSFVQTGKVQEAIKFVEALTDLQIRMEAAELLGAEITAAGDRETVLKHAPLKTMTPADRVALLRGFMEQLPDDPPPAPAAEVTDS